MFRFFLSGFATLALAIVLSCSTSETKRAETKAVYITEQNSTPTVDLPGYTLLEDDDNRRDDATAILHVKRSWPLVMQTPSREGFDSLLAKHFTFTDNGKILNREEYIKDRLAASDWKITHVIYRNVTLQFIDATTALLSYRNEVTNTHNSTGEIEVEYITWTDVYTRENKTWKISAAHVIDFRIAQANNTTGSTATHEVKDCSCLSVKPYNYSREPGFSGHKTSSSINIRNAEQWKAYTHDSVRLKVKTLHFNYMDTIPEKFRTFKNVEAVFIETRNGFITGLDNFPKLKVVHLFSSIVQFDTTEHWLKQVEILRLEKTEVKGLRSFKQMPRLVELHAGFGGFDQFPSDIESLTCLNNLILGAYMFGDVDLNTIDLSKFNCLKEATFTTWYGTLTGIPAGLDKTNVLLDVSHEKLTAAEKRKLKEYKARVKK